ncbi:MAG TPA: hypothetical protein VF525_14545 [Pyrinomonadaceae bacterium]|jgi:hypothetical protein
MYRQICWLKTCGLILVLLFVAAQAQAQTTYDERHADDATQAATTAATRRLASNDPLARQQAAEELAQLAAAGERRLVEGYRLQEKNTRVRLALDWALYRMGKAEALYAVVRALDSARAEQAAGYLAALETPQPLYLILPRVNGNTQVKLLDVLARIGDDTTLAQLKPFADSFDPKIADAARHAEQEIARRNMQQPNVTPGRPRQVGKDEPPIK